MLANKQRRQTRTNQFVRLFKWVMMLLPSEESMMVIDKYDQPDNLDNDYKENWGKAFAVDASWVFNSAIGVNQLDDFIAGFNQRSTTENVMAFAELGLAASTERPVHGNSLSSQRPTWGYKLYLDDGTFLKNGITSRRIPQTRYKKSFMVGNI